MFTWLGEKVEAMGPLGWFIFGLVSVMILMLNHQRLHPVAATVEPTDGFKCLSHWDGSHRGLVAAVTKSLRDPSSFEHIKTLVAPADDNGLHRILMTYRAKNGFGGYNVEIAGGQFSDATCALASIQLGSNE